MWSVVGDLALEISCDYGRHLPDLVPCPLRLALAEAIPQALDAPSYLQGPWRRSH